MVLDKSSSVSVVFVFNPSAMDESSLKLMPVSINNIHDPKKILKSVAA